MFPVLEYSSYLLSLLSTWKLHRWGGGTIMVLFLGPTLFVNFTFSSVNSKWGKLLQCKIKICFNYCYPKFRSKTCDLSWIFAKLSNNWSPLSNSLSTAFILSGFTRDCSKLSPNRLTSLCSILRNVFSSNVSPILWLSEIGPNIQWRNIKVP